MSKKALYVDIKPLLKEFYNFIFLIGQRSNGKSYAVKDLLLRQAYKTGRKFGYLRRYQIDVRGSDVEGYFRDAPVSAITDGVYDHISVYRGKIYFAFFNEETGKEERGQECGYVFYLSGEIHFKSQNFDDCDELIFEEVIGTQGGYLFNEVDKLESLISTIARRRKIRVWMIANSISRVCPYFSEFGLQGIYKQKQGTIDVYENRPDETFDEEGNQVVVKVAVFLTDETRGAGKMFFRKSAGMINRGQWLARPCKHLPDNYRHFKKLYEMIVEFGDFTFKLELLSHAEKGMIIFIHPHTLPSEDRDRVRLVTDRHEIGKKISNGKLTVLTKGDFLIKELYERNRVVFSDNLTGEDWDACVKTIGSFT